VLEQLSGQTPVFSKGIISVHIFAIVESLVLYFDVIVEIKKIIRVMQILTIKVLHATEYCILLNKNKLGGEMFDYNKIKSRRVSNL